MSEKIRVVDDDELIRKSLAEVLRMSGYVVESAQDGPGALEILKRGEFDVVITDLKMPGMDGLGLLKRIKENFSDVDIIIATSYGTIETAVDAMKYGATDYITKPIIDEEIKLVLRDILSRRKLRC